MCSVSHVRQFLLLVLLPIFIVAAQDVPCGTTGYHDQLNVSWFMGNFFYNGSPTLNLCASYCKKNQSCKAFRYSNWRDADAQYCEFFATSIAPNFKLDARSPYSYYDVGCVLPPFEDPVTTPSVSTLISSITVVSTLIETLTSPTSITILSTLIETLTSSTSITVVSTSSTTVTSSTSITFIYPVTVLRMSTVTRSVLPLPAPTRTVTTTFTPTSSTDAIRQQAQLQPGTVYSTTTQTLPAQTVTVQFPVRTTITSTFIRTTTRIVAPPLRPTQTVTQFSTRTVFATPLNIQMTGTVTRTVTVTQPSVLRSLLGIGW
ncbi:hypothetical protein SVAN01_03687 [Stagonosporopsis vannaccii]|nr:hypothetical protein SVAN01_03687 [Stagonosporopsis vannaccii]